MSVKRRFSIMLFSLILSITLFSSSIGNIGNFNASTTIHDTKNIEDKPTPQFLVNLLIKTEPYI